MARIEVLVEEARERVGFHDPAKATYSAYEIGGHKMLQVDTYGRSTREIPGKISQSIQLDERSGRQLFDILADHFGFK